MGREGVGEQGVEENWKGGSGRVGCRGEWEGSGQESSVQRKMGREGVGEQVAEENWKGGSGRVGCRGQWEGREWESRVQRRIGREGVEEQGEGENGKGVGRRVGCRGKWEGREWEKIEEKCIIICFVIFYPFPQLRSCQSIRVSEYQSMRVSVQFRGFLFEYFVTCYCFYGEELLAPRPNSKLENHPWSDVRDSVFNIFVSTIRIGDCSSIRNLRTRHAVVTKTHFSMLFTTYFSRDKIEKNEMGGAYSTYVREKRRIQGSVGET